MRDKESIVCMMSNLKLGLYYSKLLRHYFEDFNEQNLNNVFKLETVNFATIITGNSSKR